MEVAGQWRQQWAGAAEYGKVADGAGGVVRTARAMEVMQASGPGARLRVTRSAFRCSGPLASSYLLHSSTRRIFSSGANILLSPSLVSKPLEISSTPLDVSSDTCPDGEEAYNVTEPDDTDISEPSKWRSSGSRASLRRASEESSSTDNASLVDSGTHFARTYQPNHSNRTSLSSEIRNTDSKISSFKAKPMSSPLMKISEHAKCLESSISKPNSNKTRDDWHDRRKSYGFENSPTNNIKVLSDDDKIMESSTDSGICKSTEIVNIPVERYKPHDDVSETDIDDKFEDKQETFRDWLAKNRSSTINSPDFSSVKRSFQHSNNTVTGSPDINLKAHGKISIAFPTTASDSENGRDADTHSLFVNENTDRKYKKVEFCKTELHFAAESGIVNIIETDEKPPSSNDFRKRRSAFVPIKSQFDKPITLFGGTNLIEASEMNTKENCFSDLTNEVNYDKTIHIDQENESSVKSILKNRIPKPKPYLLGESTVFGEMESSAGNAWGVSLRRTTEEATINKTPISILNEALKEENRFVSKITRELDQRFKRVKDVESDGSYAPYHFGRRQNESPVDYVNIGETNANFKNLSNINPALTSDDCVYDTVDQIHNCSIKDPSESHENRDVHINLKISVREKLKQLQMSPVLQTRTKTRHLRQNELSFFGVPSQSNMSKDPSSANQTDKLKSTRFFTKSSDLNATDRKATKNFTKAPREIPLYQNLPIKSSFTPVPAPRIIKHKIENTPIKLSSQKDVTEQTTLKYSSDDSNDYNTDEDDNKQNTSKSPRKSKRALETIDELNNVSHGSVKKTQLNHKGSVKEIKTRGYNSSPSIIRVETLKKSSNLRRSSHKIGSNESDARSRESSLEDVAHLAIVKPRRHKKFDKHSGATTDTSNSVNVEHSSTPLVKVVEKEAKEKNKTRSLHSEHGAAISNTKTPKRTETLSKVSKQSHDKSKDMSPQRKLPDKKRSDSRTEHKQRTHSPNKESLSKQNETTIADNCNKRKTSRKPDDLKPRESIKKKEYILNYDDKNGTLSSISKSQGKHTSGRKREKYGSMLKKNEEKPKETSRNSRVISLEVPTQDLHRRTKSAGHTSPRRKHREESSK